MPPLRRRFYCCCAVLLRLGSESVGFLRSGACAGAKCWLRHVPLWSVNQSCFWRDRASPNRRLRLSAGSSFCQF